MIGLNFDFVLLSVTVTHMILNDTSIDAMRKSPHGCVCVWVLVSAVFYGIGFGKAKEREREMANEANSHCFIIHKLLEVILYWGMFAKCEHNKTAVLLQANLQHL